MGWLIAGILILGGICGLFNAWHESFALSDNTDDEVNHSDGEDDYAE